MQRYITECPNCGGGTGQAKVCVCGINQQTLIARRVVMTVQCDEHNWRGQTPDVCPGCKQAADIEELRAANTIHNRCRAHNWAGVSVCPKCVQDMEHNLGVSVKQAQGMVAARPHIEADKMKSAFKFAAEFYDTYYAHGKQPKTPVDFTAAFVECIVQWENNKRK